MSEQIIEDLKKAGSDDMGSLIDLLHNLREKHANSSEEIDKLKQLSVIKDDEVANLNIELESLRDFQANIKGNQEQKITLYTNEIAANSKVIRRQDKLIVDLQQKNEVSQNAISVTQEQA